MIHPRWSYGAVLYEMNIRQLTSEGTIKAAQERLSFLRSLAIDVIWLMPVYPIGEEDRKGNLGSYYSIRDYCDINPEMGTLDDFDNFIAEAHRLGLRVILDWVANHTARDARWVGEKPSNWYVRDQNGAPLVPWDWSDTAKLNYSNQDVWQGQIEAMKFWVERGVDGFRCDMAMLVPIEFWQRVAAELHKTKNDIFLLAEAEEHNLFDRAFDCCYGWDFHHLMVDVASGKRRADAIRDFLYRNAAEYPAWAMRMTFTSNHDENSWQGRESEVFGDSLEIMRLLSFVAPYGMPLLYTGQEVGYDHSFEFFDRDPIPDQYYRANETTAFYRKLIDIKHSCDSLAAGERGGMWTTISNNAKDCLLVLVRENTNDRVVAILNLSPYDIECNYDTGIYAGDYIDAINGGEYTLPRFVDEPMKGWSYKLLTLHKTQ
ncbi:MAG: alpha-amylase family glycosyl hydrolase [Rikenellaceae bacterium]